MLIDSERCGLIESLENPVPSLSVVYYFVGTTITDADSYHVSPVGWKSMQEVRKWEKNGLLVLCLYVRHANVCVYTQDAFSE